MKHISKLLVIVSIFLIVGCAGLPRTSRTGKIHDVKIAETLSAETLKVSAGDEVRWINYRTDLASIEFTSGVIDSISCHNGFRTVFGKIKTSERLRPGDSASLCFSKTGVFKYNVRAVATVPGGEIIIPASIEVGN